MAKIALLLSGFTRKHRLDEIAEYVIRPNAAAGNQVDIYVSTWDTYGTITNQDTADQVFTGVEYWTGQTRSYDNNELDKGLFESELAGVAPHALNIRYRNYESFAREWLADLPGGFAFGRGKDEHTILRARGMWSGMQDVYELIPEPSQYDFMIRSRFDICFTAPIRLQIKRGLLGRRRSAWIGMLEYSLESRVTTRSEHIDMIRIQARKLPESTSTLLVPMREGRYTDDWFAIGTPESMARHMTTFSRLDDYFRAMAAWPKPFENESLTVLNAVEGGVAVRTFPKIFYQ